MYELRLEHSVKAPLDDVWAVWADLESYPAWDPREEVMRLDGSFAAGTRGFSKQAGRRPGSPIVITLVEPKSRFIVETPLPGGMLVLDHLLEVHGDTVILVKRYEVRGPMSLAFRLVFARGIRAEMPSTFTALTAEVARRATGKRSTRETR